ncbi:type II CAAX endopeptidase family protein [Niallia alba]|uniref:CPBP family intramembrane glutamic endopeptidase n=1 Tax=Niallia alba TaxID=2729105 RepID=UPI002E228B0A|nr:type II CAAX endopeptidase family protein [Niallia alba]
MREKYFTKIKWRRLFIWLIVYIILFTCMDVFVIENSTEKEIDFYFKMGFHVTVFMWILYSFRKNNLSIKAVIFHPRKEKSSWGKYVFLELLGDLIAVTLLFFVILIIALNSESLIQEIINSDSEVGDSTFFIGSLFVTILVAPIVEELLFRGILFNKWSESLGAKKALFLTSFLFGVFHIGSSPIFIGQLLAGFLFCLVYMRTKSLVLPILLHIGNNCISSLGMLINVGDDTSTLDIALMLSQMKVAAIISGVILLILVPIYSFFMYKLYKTTKMEIPYHVNVKNYN